MGGLRLGAARVLALAAVFVLALSGAAWADNGPAYSWQMFHRDIHLNRDGTSTSTDTYALRANNEAGVAIASRVGEDYDALTETIAIVEAYTKKASGEIIKVAPGAIFDMQPEDDGLFITSIRRKLILFPNFEAGDTACFVVQRRTLKLDFPGKPVLGERIDPATAYDDFRVDITAPRSLVLKVATKKMAFSSEERGDERHYHWHYAQPQPEVQPEVDVSPQARWPSYFLSAFADYREIGEAYAAEMAPKLTLTPEIVAMANKIAPAGLDQLSAAARIYLWVSRHVRYVGLELGRGGHVPHAAADILANGYGDCKDHDTLFQALLKAKGIKAESVLINYGDDYELTEVPSLAVFNHVITYLPELALYADSTSQTAPFGVLPFEEYGKPVVHALPGGARAATVPLLANGGATIKTVTEETLSADGTLSGTTSITATGASSIWLRNKGLDILEDGPEQAAQNTLTDHGYQHGAGEYKVPSPFSDSPSYSISGKFTTDGWREKMTGKQSFRVPSGLDPAPSPGDGSMGPLLPVALKDDEPVSCNYVRQEQDIILHLPAGYSLRDVPGDTKLTTAHIQYTATWRVQGSTLTLSRRFESTPGVAICAGPLRAEAVGALQQVWQDQQTRLWITPPAGKTKH